jgi:hypothetical protein
MLGGKICLCEMILVEMILQPVDFEDGDACERKV